MESPPAPDLKASLLQRWFPVSPLGKSTFKQHERFSETDLRDISDVLRRVGEGAWSRIPRIYAVLRLLDRLDVIDLFLAQAISDVYFPFMPQTLPQSLNPSVAHEFLQVQRVVLSSALDLERETGRHRHFSSADDVPFMKVEELGKGAYGYVDRVISTISYKEYARKLIPRGRTFQRDQKILRDFERELGTLKKLGRHRHIVQLIGSYTDPRFVGIIMSPVAECDLKDFLNNCTFDGKSNPHSPKSLTRSFFGCLTSALSYLHDNTIRHKDIKPQNVLVLQHTVYLTDFGISLDWSEVGQSTTAGPTPKTARYCAPEVSDYAPRNTSSDMWSLGCIFLEIWTVLKGESVTNLHAFLEANGALPSYYHLNSDATFHWMKTLESKPTLADNPPLNWIRHLLVEDKGKRWTARQLLSEIETVNSNPETKFAFSGQCCMEELESTESVISSDDSFYENGASGPVPQPPAPIVPLAPMPDKEERPKAPSRMSILQHKITPSDLNGNTSNSSTIEPQSDITTLTEESITMLSVPEVALGNILRDEEGVLVTVSESAERKPHTGRSEKSALDSDQTLLKSQVDDLGRAQSMHPEVLLACLPTVESLSVSMTQPSPVKHASLSSDVFKDSTADLTSKEAIDLAIETEKAGGNDLDEKSTADVDEHAEQTSCASSLTVERTGKDDLQRQHGHSGDRGEENPIATAPEHPISRAEEPIIMDVNARQNPLPAPYQSSTFSSENNTSTHQPDEKTSYPLVDGSIPVTIRTTVQKDGLHRDDPSQSLVIGYFEGGKAKSNVDSRKTISDRLTPSNSKGHPQMTQKASSNEHKATQSNLTSLNDPASRSSDITSPADIPRIFNNIQDVSRLEGSVIPTHVLSEPDATWHPTKQDQNNVPPPPTKSNKPRDKKSQTVQVEYVAPQSQTTRGESPSLTTSSGGALVDEVESSGQARSNHDSEPQKGKTEKPNITGVDPQWPLNQSATPRDIISSSPLPSGPATPFFGSSRNKDPQRLELAKISSTDVVPYAPSVAPRANNRRNRICGKCYEPLNGHFVGALSGTFHLECFTCIDCGQMVASEFIPIPGKIIGGNFISIANPPEGHTQEIPLCEIDYFRRLDLLCRTCGGALRGAYITALDHKYHPEHFICRGPGCDTSFGESGSYYEHEGKVFCKTHYGQHAGICHGCGTAVFKQLVEIFRDGQNQKWHPECYIVHSYWNVTLKNEFAVFFIKREPPKQNNLEVPQDLVESSVDQTEELMTKILSVLSKFEESCANSISDMLLYTCNSHLLKTLSVSGYFILKIERYFMALDELHKLKQAKGKTEELMAHEQKLLCKKLIEFFSLAISVGDTRLGVTQELVTGLAHYLKCLIRNGLKAAISLDPHNKRAVIPGFLADVEKALRTDIQLDLQLRFRHNDYLSRSADFCILCQTTVDVKPGQGYYWNHIQIYHIDCINCPSCNGPPKLVYAEEGQSFVECSRCDYGSMMTFISQSFGQNFIILHFRSLVYAHLLCVAWARLANTLKPEEAPSLLILPEESLADAEQHDIPPPPPCPQGWKAYWSTPAGKYLFKNLQTSVLQWEFPELGDSSNNQTSSSQETVLHRPAPSHNAQNPKLTTNPGDFNRYSSLTLNDIPRIVAAEQARARNDRPTDRPSMIFGTNRPDTPEHGRSQSLNGVSQIVPSPSDEGAQIVFSSTDLGTRSFDKVGVLPVGKKKSSFFDKWRKRSRGFI